MNLQDQKQINNFILCYLNSKHHLDDGSVFHVRVAKYTLFKEGVNAFRVVFITNEGLGDKESIVFFAEEFVDPKNFVEDLMLRLGCLPTWSWSESSYHGWFEGQFAYESNRKCSWGFLSSLKV